MSQIVLATRNKGKIAELSAMLEEYGIEVKSLADFPDIPEIPETGTTFEENALIKAKAVCEATGLVAVADDSGLEVDALDGRPGIYSARYSGENATDESNYLKLLDELMDVPEEMRSARFVCCMMACAPNGETLKALGTWDGRILHEPVGDQGFGYDPVFMDPDAGVSNAQLSREEKNARSHRGKALRALLANWADFWKKAAQK